MRPSPLSGPGNQAKPCEVLVTVLDEQGTHARACFYFDDKASAESYALYRSWMAYVMREDAVIEVRER